MTTKSGARRDFGEKVRVVEWDGDVAKEDVSPREISSIEIWIDEIAR